MNTASLRVAQLLCASAALLSCAPLFQSHAQSKQSAPSAAQPQQQSEDVLRISTDLVQTDVTVLDKQGRFVDNLRREQFELLVDGKPQPIAFFERVVAGSSSEELQLAAARGTTSTQQPGMNIRPFDRGRTIFFFVDDLHMSAESLIRVRKALAEFIDKEMEQNDQIAISSTSGQVGFLQQLTDNKIVLRAANSRLKSFGQVLDSQLPPMAESLALAIEVYNDRDVLKYFVQAMLLSAAPPPSGPAIGLEPRESASNAVGSQAEIVETIVKARAKRILQHAYHLSLNTLTTLESLASSAGQLSGRKLVFFISEGFLINRNQSDMAEKMNKIADTASRNGVVIYSLDARGLGVSGAGSVETTRLPTVSLADGDMTNVFARYTTGEFAATQEPLREIAANTGGRALLNTNSLDTSIQKAIEETSIYYLLAWRPENAAQPSGNFRKVEVRLAGQPDLKVQVRRGYYDVGLPKNVTRTEKVEVKRTPTKTVVANALREAIASPYPTNTLPTQLGLVYTDTPDKGTVLTASIQIARQFMTYSHTEDRQMAVIDLTGVVLNDQGKAVANFKDRLDVAVYFPQYVGQPRRDLVYNFQAPLPPGLYQVRVATRDNKSGRVGSNLQWIQIPDLSTRKLSLSSLLVGETTKEAEGRKSDAAQIAESLMSVDHRFERTSKLRFLFYIYNAARAGNATTAQPDLTMQVQILRNDQPVITTPLRKVEYQGLSDLARIPYAAEIPLKELPPGRYALQVNVIDRIAKTSVSQRANFEIE